MEKLKYRNTNPIDGATYGCGFGYQKATWFVNYDFQLDETALVIGGSDGIGVFFIILRGDHRNEFDEIVKKNDGLNEGIYGCLGECIRFACEHEDVIPWRCTIGGWGSKLSIVKSKLDFKTDEEKQND